MERQKTEKIGRKAHLGGLLLLGLLAGLAPGCVTHTGQMALSGAALGAAIGSGSRHSGRGALAGALVGGLLGGMVGNEMDWAEGQGQAPAYYPPGTAYYPPGAAYYRPAPVYYRPAPVYYRPAPVVRYYPCYPPVSVSFQYGRHGHRRHR